jgi:hypothetical protein
MMIILIIRQGWPSTRVRWATALSLTPKLGIIPKIFKALIILKDLKLIKKKIERAHRFKTNL